MRHCSVCYSELEPGGDLNRHQIPETCVKKLALRLDVVEGITGRLLAEKLHREKKKVKRKKAVEGWRGGHDG